MNILFLTISRIENINDFGIYTDLLRTFRDNGHKVYIVSARQKRDRLPTEYAIDDGCSVLRVKVGNITKSNLIEKGIATIKLEKQYLDAIKLYMKDIKFDLVMYSTPPITFDKVIRFIKKRDGAKSYLLLKDIFPQNAVDLNMFSRTNPVYWYFRNKEKNLYKNSDYIGCMSQANVEYLLNHNPEIPPNTVEVCPNSIEPQTMSVNEMQKQEIRSKYNIPINKTIFIYGGNLGKPQGINFLIECLKRNEKNNSSYILIVGSGTEFNKLKDYFESEKPKNSKLLYQLPKRDYELLANSCDVGLIFLDKRFTIPNFPSRLLSYMQASMPVLAATDINTDIGKTIEQGEFGFWCESSNVNEFNRLLIKLCDIELRAQMGANAIRYLEDNYSVKHSYEIIMKHFEN